MPCDYGIDAKRHIVYLIAEGEVAPHEFIDTLRALRHDASHQPHFDILADLRRMNPPFFDADLRLITYYISAISKRLRGRFALLFSAEQKEAVSITRWADWIGACQTNIAAFSSASEAQQWFDNRFNPLSL